MASYVVPQVEIHQLFSELPAALTQNQVSFIFGPNYLLHRYTDANEKEGTYVGEYDSRFQKGYKDDDTGALDLGSGTASSGTASSGTTSSDPDAESYFFPYPNVLDETEVDRRGYTKLYADNCVVGLETFPGIIRVDGKPDEVEIPVTDVNRLEVSVGRKFRFYCVRSGQEEASEVDYIKRDVTIVDVDTEDHVYDDKVRVMLDEELDDDLVIVKALLCEIRQGVEITREDLYNYEVSGNTDSFNWIETKGEDAYGKEVLGVQIRRQFWVKINDPDYQKRNLYHGFGFVLSADLFVQYRELVDSAADTIHTLTGASEVVAALGAVSPDNPLAMGVYNAALNSGGQIVRYMAVRSDDLEGYSRVLEAATLTKEVYFLVPMTRDIKILDLVKSHVVDMSAPTMKRWRIAFVSAVIPEGKTMYGYNSVTGEGKECQARVIAVNTAEKTADVEFVVKPLEGMDEWIPSPDTKFKRDIVKDDLFVTSFQHQEWGKTVPQAYKVVKVLTNNRLRVSDPNGELYVKDDGGEDWEVRKSEMYHPYTNTEKASAIANQSSYFASRRIYNIFPDKFAGSGFNQTGEMAAACVAGLVSSCLPQQPITNVELTGINDIPETYETFSAYDLNVMASGGTFIVMQDLPNDQVYVRHQISTKYEDNNLNESELSITKNLDSISFFFDNLLSPYIGKYNVTPKLLGVLRATILNGLQSLEATEWGLYGPQVIAEGTEILLLEQDALLKDHVNCNIQLNMPYPFNRLVLKLFV